MYIFYTMQSNDEIKEMSIQSKKNINHFKNHNLEENKKLINVANSTYPKEIELFQKYYPEHFI